MSDFTLLHGSLLNSSLWVTGTKEVRLLWVTMMAMKDKDGVVNSSFLGLMDRSKLTKDECVEALRVLMAPDPDDSSGVAGGIRVKEIPGRGWFLVNHERYRYSPDYMKAKWRESKATQRANVSKKKHTSQNGMPPQTEEQRQEEVLRQAPADQAVRKSIRDRVTREKSAGK